MTTDLPIDEVAQKAAQLSQRTVELRRQIARIAGDSAALDVAKAELLLHAELNATTEEFNRLLYDLLPTVIEIAGSVARKNGLGPHAKEEFLGEAQTKIAGNLHKFDLNKSDKTFIMVSTGANQPAPSRFRAWTRTVLSRLFIDGVRRNKRWKRDRAISSSSDSNRGTGRTAQPQSKGLSEDPNSRNQFPSDTGNASANSANQRLEERLQPVRDLPDQFTSEEELDLGQLSETCIHLFLFSTALWHLLSEESKARWQAAKPTEWEASQFNAMARANRFLQNVAEDQYCNRQQAKGKMRNMTFDQLRVNLANSFAQNLNRHFWRFLRLNTAWQHLFQHIEPFTNEFQAELAKELNRELLAGYLFTDVLFACSSSDRCFGWLEDMGLDNSIDCNFGRIAGQNSYIGNRQAAHSIEINPKKWEYVCRFCGIEIDESDAQDFMVQCFDNSTEARRQSLAKRVAPFRKHIDLPLPFERFASDALVENSNSEGRL